MTTQKNARHEKNSRIKEEFQESQKGQPILGEIVSWSERGATHSYQEVQAGLDAAGLDKGFAKAILPAQAFQRAATKLKEARVIDQLNKAGDNVTFQLTAKTLHDKAGNKEWKYSKETELTLNLTSGKITCPVAQLEKFAQTELDRAIDTRTSGDITKIIKAIFVNADPSLGIIDLTESGGCYLVLHEHSHFCDKVQSFLVALGRNLQRFPIAGGKSKAGQEGKESVANAVSDQMEKLCKDLEKKLDEFTIATRQDTIDKLAEDIKDLRIKIQSCSHYLLTRHQDAVDFVDEVDKRLVQRIQELTEERKNAPPRTSLESGVGIVAFIEQKLREATPKKPVTQEAILAELVEAYPDRPEKGMKHTVYVQLNSQEYSSLFKKGLNIVKGPNGYHIEK